MKFSSFLFNDRLYPCHITNSAVYKPVCWRSVVEEAAGSIFVASLELDPKLLSFILSGFLFFSVPIQHSVSLLRHGRVWNLLRVLSSPDTSS